MTEAAHLHPSLIITAWWPGAQAPVWSSHNASGVETSRQAPASLCFRHRGDQGHHPGVTCAAMGRDVRDPARALTPRIEKRAHRQPHGAPRQAPVSPRPASAWEKRPHTQHHPLGGGSKRQRVPRTSSQAEWPNTATKNEATRHVPMHRVTFPRAPGIEAWTPDWGPRVSRRPQSLGYTTPRNICGGAFGNCYTHLQTLNSA